MMRRYAAVTDQTLRAAAEAVSGNELGRDEHDANVQAVPAYPGMDAIFR